MPPFIGSEAIARGQLTRGQLRSKYTAIHPDVYIERSINRTLTVNIHAAALWARATITGRAAAALHGVRWVDASTPIELIGPARRRRAGVIVRNERIADDELSQIGPLTVATPVRAALDIARHLPRNEAVMHLDALTAATGIAPDAIQLLASRYVGARGIHRARGALALVDNKAQSPKETWLRLLLIDAGFPRPSCQIAVHDGFSTAFIDMGWEEVRIGLEYDGDQHRTERTQFVRDIGRLEMLDRQGWLIIRVVKEHSRAYILHRVRNAFARRQSEFVTDEPSEQVPDHGAGHTSWPTASGTQF